MLHKIKKTRHQERVEEFMRKAGQQVPAFVIVPDLDVRRLRAKLTLEECIEKINALGFSVIDAGGDVVTKDALIVETSACDLIEVVDGCADMKVIATGTLSAFGIKDSSIQKEVDQSNLAKFGEGGYQRDDGKWIKPADWKPPRIAELLKDQGYDA